MFKAAVADAAHEVDADLADSIVEDEASVEIQLGRTAQAAGLLRGVKQRDSGDFAILQAQAGDIAAGEALFAEARNIPRTRSNGSCAFPS